MIDRNVFMWIIDTLVMLCCGSMAATGLYIYLHNSNPELLAFIVSGFVLIVFFALLISLRYAKISINLPQLLMRYCITIFQLITGILLLISIIHKKFPHKQGIKHWDIIIPPIFVIEIFLSGILDCLLTLELLHLREENHSTDIENSLISSSPNVTIIEQEESNTNNGNKNNFHVEVVKKASGQTLVDDETVHKIPFDSIPMEKDEKKDIYADIIKSMETRNSMEYTNYIDENWMEHGSVLNSLKSQFKIDELNSDVAKSRKGSFSLFGTSKSESPKRLRFSHTKSISNMSSKTFKPSYYLRNSQSMPAFIKESKAVSNENMKMEQYPSKSLSSENENRRVSLINSIEDFRKSKEKVIEEYFTDDDFIIPEADNSKCVQRSKSTSQINKPNNSKKRQQRWRSINDERVFLSNVSQSLLPSVLKTGESPIMKIKRQQEFAYDAQGNRSNFEDPISPVGINEFNRSSILDSPLSYKRRKFSTGNVFPEEIINRNGESNPPIFNNIYDVPSIIGYEEEDNKKVVDEEDEDDDDSLKLQYISEFDEKKIDNIYFKDFDQTTFKNSEYKDSENLDNYPDSMKGLEEIPKSFSQININWNKQKRNISELSHISLKDWNNSQKVWNETQSRSGAQFQVRLTSDHNFDETKRMLLSGFNDGKDYLIQPVKSSIDNVDNLSDLSDLRTNSCKEVQRPYNLLNRSYSAPSLHTFRNLSQGSVPSNESDNSYSSVEYRITPQEYGDLRKIRTPEPKTSNTSSSSPIKKFFLESPKRITSVFRRKSIDHRQSYDLGPAINSHKHTLSTASYQYSLNSTASSKSTSPKRSHLKSILQKPEQRNSIPYFSLPSLNSKSVLAQPKSGLNYFNSEKPSPGFQIKINLNDTWDLEPSPSSDQSRVSSVPSVVIGEYDREKWNKLKEISKERV